jgi:hypothetical protein
MKSILVAIIIGLIFFWTNSDDVRLKALRLRKGSIFLGGGCFLIAIISILTDATFLTQPEASFLGVLGILLLISAAVAPRSVLVEKESSLFLLQFAALLIFWFSHNRWVVLGGLCFCIIIQYWELRSDALKGTHDDRRFVRARSYGMYQILTVTGFFLYTVFQGKSNWVGLTGLFIASFASVGIFPLHSWAVPFIASPRRKIFSTILTIALGLAILVKYMLPALGDHETLRVILRCCGGGGLLYFALLLFGENRLKRIGAYLYLAHACGQAIVISTLFTNDQMMLGFEMGNVLLSLTGLLVATSVLASRFGVEGVRSQTGLSQLYPEVGFCFLLCTLSLVGFPGTLGFYGEEILVESMHGNILLLLCGLIAIGLNGYSCFRIFGNVFGGVHRGGRIETEGKGLLLREQFAISSVVFLVVLNGLAPVGLAIIGKLTT